MVELRRISPGEWQEWRELRLRALADAPDAFGATLEHWRDADERRWRARLEDVPLNVIAYDGGPVGQVSGTAPDDDGRVELISMWVAPGARGRGVSDQLVDFVIDWARGEGAAVARLSVRRANEPAIRLYERVGFVQTGRQGDEASELEMVKVLDDSNG